jgi:hypothetical protein
MSESRRNCGATRALDSLGSAAQTKEAAGRGSGERKIKSRIASHDAISRGMLFRDDIVSNSNPHDWLTARATAHGR